MANLKNIKTRINSIISTQKITRAMKMVASAKVKKFENKVKASRPFTYELEKMFYRLLHSVSEIEAKETTFKEPLNNYPVLLEEKPIKNVGLLIITSNKGLSGAFNANLVRYTLKTIREYKENGIGCELFIIGQKGYNVLKRQAEEYGFKITKTYLTFSESPTSSQARLAAADMARSFVNGDIQSMEIITTRFRNMMSYSVEKWDILPLDEIDYDYIKEDSCDMEIEPNASSVLSELVPLFITSIIFQAMLESSASELASRMTAMSAACNNADEMIKKLTIDYNKARQAMITQELTEITSGSASVNK
ncbi:MAG: ATP synthase F1 subunit gamma [Candidatus Gastranaerophilales bacterium]|nr:ATP synthase F1 subunit gamma [Candidatus Gastranaerophilales bacterium]